MLEIPGGYVLDRDHVAAPAVELLATLHRELTERMSDAVEGWPTRPALGGILGSAARRDGDADTDDATPSVAASLAVLAGIAASDAACCARLGARWRGQAHLRAVDLVSTVVPGGIDMARDLQRLLNRKDDSQYGVAFVSPGEADRMVGWAKRLLRQARRTIEA